MSIQRPVTNKSKSRFVRELVAIINNQANKVPTICSDAGLSHDIITRWTSGHYKPSVTNLEAVLNVLGYTLVIQPKAPDEVRTTARILAAAPDPRVD